MVDNLAADDDAPFHEYVALLRRLHLLMGAGQDESPEADALRDDMDRSWYRMSPEQVERVDGLSADLNSLEDPPVPPPTVPDAVARRALESLPSAVEQERWEDVLKLLRHAAKLMTPEDLACLRGRAWFGLRDTDTALFFNGAARHALANRRQPAAPAGSPITGRRSRRSLTSLMAFTEEA